MGRSTSCYGWHIPDDFYIYTLTLKTLPLSPPFRCAHHDTRTHARTQQLKQRTTHAFQEVSVLRAELERAEAAVVGGKKKRDIDIAARETQLRRYEEEIRTLKAEVCVGVIHMYVVKRVS